MTGRAEGVPTWDGYAGMNPFYKHELFDVKRKRGLLTLARLVRTRSMTNRSLLCGRVGDPTYRPTSGGWARCGDLAQAPITPILQFLVLPSAGRS